MTKGNVGENQQAAKKSQGLKMEIFRKGLFVDTLSTISVSSYIVILQSLNIIRIGTSAYDMLGKMKVCKVSAASRAPSMCARESY